MAKLDQEKFAVKGRLVEIANRLARFLDPGLSSKSQTEQISGEEQWPLRKTLLFVLGISLALWAASYVVFRFLLGP